MDTTVSQQGLATPPGLAVDATPATTVRGFELVHVRDAAALAAHVDAWNDLAASAPEPNVFHEPFFLRPAIEGYAGEAKLHLVFAYERTATGRGRLCAMFPFEHARSYHGLPLRHLRLWRPVHAYLGTPLVRAEHTREVIDALHDWLTGPDGTAFVEWGWIAPDGAFFQALADAISRRDLLAHVAQAFSRAFLRRNTDADSYLRAAFSAKALREFRRHERRLKEAGTVEYVELASGADSAPWVEDFLRLEASGWKGRKGSALGASPRGRRFFSDLASGAARHDRLAMIALRVDGRPIAMLCKLLSGEGAFAFKMAYDEAWSRFSPGMLLEIEHIRRFHERASPAWMDSCAAPVHFMADRVWSDRRALATVLTSTGRAPGDFALSVIPLARWVRRKLKGKDAE
jgi:CelD/BcsL family acetyltransferase involved in cellulose biosynthesis